VDARSILGLQHLWTSLLDDLPAAGASETEAGNRARLMIRADDDEPDDDIEDDDEFDEDGESDEDDDEDNEDGEEEETWQVFSRELR
jgi:hypothetical protein